MLLNYTNAYQNIYAVVKLAHKQNFSIEKKKLYIKNSTKINENKIENKTYLISKFLTKMK